MTAAALKPRRYHPVNVGNPFKRPTKQIPLPNEVRRAQKVNWGVLVDAYLMQAAPVGNRFAAVAYADQSGRIADGTTVATAPVRSIAIRGGFQLLQTLDASDHYVLVTELKS